MKKAISVTVGLLFVLALSGSLLAKGITSRITIEGADLSAPIGIGDPDPSSNRGYVHLPGRADKEYRLNTSAILRGVEGNWFRATSEWERLVTPLIARAGG